MSDIDSGKLSQAWELKLKTALTQGNFDETKHAEVLKTLNDTIKSAQWGEGVLARLGSNLMGADKRIQERFNEYIAKLPNLPSSQSALEEARTFTAHLGRKTQ